MWGLNLPALDILGKNRILDGNADGNAQIDMGAYEFVAEVTGIEPPDIRGSDTKIKTYPNPFSSCLTIEYELEQPGEVVLTIYDSIGQAVTTLVNEFQPQGGQQVEWNAESLLPGIYYCRLTSGNQVITQKILKHCL